MVFIFCRTKLGAQRKKQFQSSLNVSFAQFFFFFFCPVDLVVDKSSRKLWLNIFGYLGLFTSHTFSPYHPMDIYHLILVGVDGS